MSRKTKAAEFEGVGYNINVIGRHVLVTEPMKDYAIDKVSKIERFAGRIIDVTIRMDIQKLEHRVDIIMQVDHVKIRSKATSDDMYVSIDMAVDKLQNQLIKYKKRIQDHIAKKLSWVDMRVNVLNVSEELEEINDEIESETNRLLIDSYKPHKVVKSESRPLKMLTINEALMKLELSGDNFLIFRCQEDQKLKVVYQKKDGNFGIIDIEA